MRYFCPGFRNMDRDERIRFWVWTMASISYVESTCGTDPSTRRPKYDANARYATHVVGEFQMEADVNKRYWRGPNCRNRSVVTFQDNMSCALDELRRMAIQNPAGAPFGNARVALMRVPYIPKDKTATVEFSRSTKAAENVVNFPGCEFQGRLAVRGSNRVYVAQQPTRSRPKAPVKTRTVEASNSNWLFSPSPASTGSYFFGLQ